MFVCCFGPSGYCYWLINSIRQHSLRASGRSGYHVIALDDLWWYLRQHSVSGYAREHEYMEGHHLTTRLGLKINIYWILPSVNLLCFIWIFFQKLLSIGSGEILLHKNRVFIDIMKVRSWWSKQAILSENMRHITVWHYCYFH